MPSDPPQYKDACPMYEDRMNGEIHFVFTSNAMHKLLIKQPCT